MSPPKREGIGGAAGRLKEPLSSGRVQLLKRMADMVGFDNAACHHLFAINRSRIRLGAADAATVEIEPCNHWLVPRDWAAGFSAPGSP